MSVDLWALVVVCLCATDLLTASPTVEDVLTAVKKLVHYYAENHKEMNLDGIYGLRVLEGESLLCCCATDLHSLHEGKSGSIYLTSVPLVPTEKPGNLRRGDFFLVRENYHFRQIAERSGERD